MYRGTKTQPHAPRPSRPWISALGVPRPQRHLARAPPVGPWGLALPDVRPSSWHAREATEQMLEGGTRARRCNGFIQGFTGKVSGAFELRRTAIISVDERNPVNVPCNADSAPRRLQTTHKSSQTTRMGCGNQTLSKKRCSGTYPGVRGRSQVGLVQGVGLLKDLHVRMSRNAKSVSPDTLGEQP